MKTIKELREIQANGSSHDVIDALITYLEGKDESTISKVTKAVIWI